MAKVIALVEKFGATNLAAEIGTPKSHISAVTAGTRGVGDDLAAKFDAFAVERLGVAQGWIDTDDEQPHEAPFRDLDAFEAQLVTLFRKLPSDSHREHLLTMLDQAVNNDGANVTVLAQWASGRRTENRPVDQERRRSPPAPYGSQLPAMNRASRPEMDMGLMLGEDKAGRARTPSKQPAPVSRKGEKT